ncbi:MAG: gamma-glutamyltransferase [Candidatus Latescibacteria bacterium]|nr:gamma-glutamyltransferase [Candidatus Latescibacterota bacterium]
MPFSGRGLVHRSTVTGTQGMVASAHPLATLAGVRMLLNGGNAFDAVVAVAAALNVVEPYMSGIAGVGYALVRNAQDKTMRVLDYCGPTPHEARAELFHKVTDKDHGPRSCLVPGACAGWLELLAKHGTMSPAQVFAPAIELAENGYAVTVRNAQFMSDNGGHLYQTAEDVILSRGRAPLPGEILVQKNLAQTFRRVAEGGVEAFYRGDLAKEMVSYIQGEGGWLSEKDLAEFQPEWVEPIMTNYRGYDIYVPPPPSAGFQILQTLNMLEGFDLAGMGHHAELALHLFIEAVKLGNADRVEYAADKDIDIDGLISKAYAAKRRALIGERAGVHRGEYYPFAKLPGEIEPGQPGDWLNECTTHFDVVDKDGNSVAITQSLGSGFGSGMVVGNTGMFLNNFIRWGDLVPGSPNCIRPNMKLDMCLSPMQVLQNGNLFSALGTPGSWGIQQTSVQFLTNVLDYNMNIQAGIEAPRFRLASEGTSASIESRVPDAVLKALEKRGHDIKRLPDWSPICGGAQGIVVDPDTGAMMGGADPRRDGYAIGI